MNKRFISAKSHGQSRREQIANGKKRITHKRANEAHKKIVSSLASSINTLRRELDFTKKQSDFYLSQIQAKDKQINDLLEIVASCKKENRQLKANKAAILEG